MGAWASRPPILSNVKDSWSKFSHVAGELVTVLLVTFFVVKVGQLVKHPPRERVSAHHCPPGHFLQLCAG